jgi:hypothetical protein
MESILVPAEAAGNAAAANAMAKNRPIEPAVNAAQREVLKNAAQTAKSVAKKFSRNNAKASLLRVMKKYELKPSGALIQQLLGLHRKGKNNTPFLAELNAKSAAAAAKRANRTLKKARFAQNVLSPLTWKNIKQQVDMNVAASSMKVNALNRRALAFSRKVRPNLSVANFMRNRLPRKRTKRVVPENNRYALQRDLMR